jgi:hypothetical protein
MAGRSSSATLALALSLPAVTVWKVPATLVAIVVSTQDGADGRGASGGNPRKSPVT